MSCYYRYSNGWTRSREQELEQEQAQRQAQAQAQAQDQDQEQKQKNVFKEIGNVHIDMFNDNVLVAVLVVVAWLSGHLDGAGIQELLDRFVPAAPAR
jgi:Ser/Thr protein kinase RdoA (MazF antagonist)